jgi:hypothetical protein
MELFEALIPVLFFGLAYGLLFVAARGEKRADGAARK